MKIINTIGWQTPWLRKVVGFCCRELDYTSGITQAHFTLCHNAPYRGRAYLVERKIRVKINPLTPYPKDVWALRSLPPLCLSDAVELLIKVTAHEIAHLELWERRGHRGEVAVDQLARMVLSAFRSRRVSLLEAWGDSGPGPIPPGVIHRLRCPRCGNTALYARRPRDATRRVCLACFKTFDEGKSEGAFMIYDRYERST